MIMINFVKKMKREADEIWIVSNPKYGLSYSLKPLNKPRMRHLVMTLAIMK